MDSSNTKHKGNVLRWIKDDRCHDNILKNGGGGDVETTLKIKTGTTTAALGKIKTYHRFELFVSQKMRILTDYFFNYLYIDGSLPLRIMSLIDWYSAYRCLICAKKW